MNESYWYRYEDVCYAAPCDEFGYSTGRGTVRVELVTFHVLRHTPKGVWLSRGGWGKKRFALRECRKRFAAPSIEQARESFIARKRAQIRIYAARIQRAEESLWKLETVK